LKNEIEFIKKLLNTKQRDKAFKELLNLYQERLYWHIRKIVLTHEDANDVMQNTFLRVYKSLPNFKQKSSLHTWMYRIAYNESLRFIEKNKKRLNISFSEIENTYLNSLEGDSFFNGDEVQLKLQSILSEIPEKQLRIFQMKYYDDLKFSEIEEILSIKIGTIKSSYYKTVKHIEKNIVQIELLS